MDPDSKKSREREADDEEREEEDDTFGEEPDKPPRKKSPVRKQVVIDVDSITEESSENTDPKTPNNTPVPGLIKGGEGGQDNKAFDFGEKNPDYRRDDEEDYRETQAEHEAALATSGFAVAGINGAVLKQESDESDYEYERYGSYNEKRSKKRKNGVNGRHSKSDEDLARINEEKESFKNQIQKAKGFFPTFKKYSKKKTSIDRTPHKLFVELLELVPTTYGGLEWKETARWIKYEEDVEGADNRWGKPHIACLHFNALFYLKKALEKGALLFDMEAKDLSEAAECIASNLAMSNQITEDQLDSINGILLLRRNHNKEYKPQKKKIPGVRRLSMAVTNSESSTPEPGRKMSRRFSETSSKKKGSNLLIAAQNENIEAARDRSNSSAFYAKVDTDSDTDTKEKYIDNAELLRKLPPNAEATSVLVGSVNFLDSPCLAFVRLSEGVYMDNVVEVPIPVRFFFLLLGPENPEVEYHEVGRALSTLMSDKYFHKIAYTAMNRDNILTAINAFLEHTVVLPPSEWKDEELIPIDKIRKKTQHFQKKKREGHELHGTDSIAQKVFEEKEVLVQRDPLERKGKLFHGLIEDVKIRYPQYLSDIKDAFSTQVLSTIIFIYFATLSSAITFGGIYGDLSNGLIGVGETLLVTSLTGILFAFLAAQPLLIVGPTGPLMVFDISLQKFCESMEVDFLSIRVWIGIWILLFGIICVAFELVSIVKKFTRFSEEIFSTFVCIIFIYGAFEKLGKVFKYHPLSSSSFYDDLFSEVSTHPNATNEHAKLKKHDEPNTALLSMCFMFATFFVAYKLKHLRNSKYFGRTIRRALGDFGVPIAIFLMVVVDLLIRDTYTDKLTMPKGLQPTRSDVRGWLVNPFGVTKDLPIWAIFLACPASLLLFIFVFLEENISQLILSKPERCMKKGTGFHLDLLLSCLVNTIAGFLGAPFMGPAVVKTIVHLAALTVMSTNVAPGESPKTVGCVEQRVSALVVSIMNGLSVFLSVILNFVPTSVLFGIFLYMGVSATAGIQLLERAVLLFVPVKHHPNVPYVKRVRTRKMHVFTLIQLAFVILLWGLKQSPAALAIPFILMCLIPIRFYLLPLLFSRMELIALDGKDQSMLDDPDFYEEVHNLPTQIEKEHDH